MNQWSYTGAVLILLAFIGMLWAKTSVREHAKSLVKTFFDKELENHRHMLSLEAEAIRHDYQRRIQDFALFSVKKHDAYANLFQKFSIAHGAILALDVSLREYQNIQEIDDNELLKFLDTFKAPQQRKSKIIELRQSGQIDEARAETIQIIRLFEYSKAEALYQEAKNDWLLSRIFLSDDVDHCCDELSLTLIQLFTKLQFGFVYHIPRSEGEFKEIQGLKEFATDRLNSLQDLMRSDLLPNIEQSN